MLAVLIDSYPVFLNGLTQVFVEAIPDIQLRKFPGLSFFLKEQEVPPDLIVLGVNEFPKPDTIELFRTVVQRMPGSKTIVYYDEPAMALPFFDLGACAFVAKKNSLSEFLNCLSVIAGGNRYLSSDFTSGVSNNLPEPIKKSRRKGQLFK